MRRMHWVDRTRISCNYSGSMEEMFQGKYHYSFALSLISK
jgi:hypothetical protein